MGTLSVICVPNLALPARQPASTTTPSRQVPGTPVAHLSHQWLDLYDRGKVTFPGIAVTASIAHGYIAWALRHTPGPGLLGRSWSRYYLAAIAITMGIVPYTVVVMAKTNNALKAHATRDDTSAAEGTKGMVVSEQEKAQRAKQDGEVPGLLQKWAALNLTRAVLPLVGAALGFYAATA